jgi:periplasmic divalent cation tolerance protein
LKTDVAVVLMTAPDEEVAAKIANTLLDERLIACANVIPGVRSLYTWEGKRCDEREVLVVMKTATDFEALRARVCALHPYSVPEVLQLAVGNGHVPYLDWVLASTRS